ncbi:hypothetical protein LNQ82_04585 [Conchiformibius steedae DSM 2580]|uniref:Uncharacterized protein n=1 Tax=Conchiformibius steedae DSM 2580 TaxID=1121352 RepID=A0AAE9HUY2_9NEIS|nr:hypothetical protein [Conchiformibius steedae]QMT33767.1 hypothetical protein H3L98_01665 [Conchiformibius steedae]URD68428.1 hypothetical protein LNQ82_04585 [Conchiformibius steedae DSM 2580]
MNYSTTEMVSRKLAADAGWAGLYLTAYAGLALLAAYLLFSYVARKKPKYEAISLIVAATLLTMLAVCVKYFVRV